MRLLKLAILAFVLTLPARTSLLFAQTAQALVPTVTTIAPASGARGSSISVTLTGTDFESGLTVNAGDGIAVTDIVVTNTTTVTSTFTIATTSSLGQHNVTVTTSGGTSVPKVFTVTAPPPTFTGLTPDNATVGSTTTVSLSGTNFVAGLTLDVGADITVRGLSLLSSSSATATLTIASGAALGARNFTVTTPGGTSEGLPFTVTAPAPPTLTGISPAIGVQGALVTVTLSGTNFISGLAVDAIDGVTVTSIGVVNSTTATAFFAIAADATLGARDVTVTTAGGTSGAAGFSVVVVPPTLTGISPLAGNQGTLVAVTLTGSDFAPGLSVEPIPEITISNVSVTNSSAAKVVFAIDAAATLGPRDVRVTTPGGTSGTVTFRVLPASPTLTGIDPSSGSLGTAVMVTLTGTNFVAPMTIALGTDIAVSNINVIDSTTASATFTIGLSAQPGLQNVTITTLGGSSSAALFSVVPLAPTLTSITPASAVQSSLGRTFPVTLTGTNLFDPTISISGTGVRAPANVVVTSATTGTAVFTVDGDAAIGPRDVTVTTAAGTSAPVTFSVLPPAPTLTSITPAIGVRGSSVNVTILGTNFTAGSTTLSSIAGITISNPIVVDALTLTATFAIDPNAALGARSVTATTGLGTTNALTFTIADSFPDLSITSSHGGRFGVGFNETYTVTVTNIGTRPTSGMISVSDALPPGLTFVSGLGTGWSCSAAGQNVTCTTSAVLAGGAASSFTLTVAVGTTAASAVNHTVVVTSVGDLNAANDSMTDPTTITPAPAPAFAFSPPRLVPGEQATVAVRLVSSFPHDITGTVTLSFIPNSLFPVDDPAIQFETGGRVVTFTIPANNTQARFGSAADPAPIGFQTGTVAGRLIFDGTFTAGSTQGSFSPPVGNSAPSIPQMAPVMKSIDTTMEGGFVASILLFSTMREVTELNLTFDSNPPVKLSCGATAGCSVSGSTITFDVTSLFNTWYASDTTYGSLNLLRLPINIDGKVSGRAAVSLKNRYGYSNVISFVLLSTGHFVK